MADVISPPQPMASHADSEANIKQFKDKLNALIERAASGSGDFTFPPGSSEGVGIWEPMPGQYDIFFTHTPSDGSDEKFVEVHLHPDKNPRDLYDEAKATALKEDAWGKIVGWIENPNGFPNRNEYDDIRLCGLEEKQPWNVRWVQQTRGEEGGYFVRLETTYMAPEAYLREFADAVWWVVNEVGYFNPAQ